ncbi:MAG: arsenate reductase [Alphaproteobacteria bacterium]|jgi:arsenate reductase (glutaredoxin)|nr:arsenate reductase [Rhodospirillaceae bacterium]MDG2481687.1 arsenate reductase [Alphaproteobacteria bacterium]MBT6206276.1 arsenate reductase [Rhodospirillaceae bacterium]MBT6508951.1 arsenate reductase [Rhodospirillaceae bacterium]MBT7614236.1 arsenate reductase [Rhodospirillaceae bacterium]
MLTVYGLKNCDTCKKALAWLKANNIEHRYHDVRADGLDAGAVASWMEELGHAVLVNTRGTTWRGLPDEDKADLDSARAIDLIMAQPAIMKRPVFDLGNKRLVGFKPAQQEELLAYT